MSGLSEGVGSAPHRPLRKTSYPDCRLHRRGTDGGNLASPVGKRTPTRCHGATHATSDTDDRTSGGSPQGGHGPLRGTRGAAERGGHGARHAYEGPSRCFEAQPDRTADSLNPLPAKEKHPTHLPDEAGQCTQTRKQPGANDSRKSTDKSLDDADDMPRRGGEPLSHPPNAARCRGQGDTEGVCQLPDGGEHEMRCMPHAAHKHACQADDKLGRVHDG